MELIHISEAEDGRVVAVFQGDTYLPELTLLRQQSAEVIRQTTHGHPGAQGGRAGAGADGHGRGRHENPQ